MSIDALDALAKTSFDDPEKIGSNCRKEDNFLELKHLLSAANDPNSNLAGINWPEVSRLSAEILGKESKDILVSCYLSVGLLKTEGLNGLAVGLGVIDNLVKEYWETLYPPLRRLNGRWSAFEWLVEQLTDYLEGLQGQRPKSEVEPVLEQFKSLDKNLSDLSDEAPNFLVLIRSFERIIAPEETPEVKEEAPPSNDVADTTSVDVSLDSISSVDDALDKLSGLWENAAKIADYLKEKDAELAIAYRLARMSIWQVVKMLPPGDKDNVTRVPPPDRNLVKQLNLLLDANNQQGIITTCELWALENPYWFDLNYIICNAFESTGKPEVSKAIKSEILSLYHRFPDIIKLKFSDKTAMVGQEALAWLQEDLASDGQVQTISMDDRENLSDIEKQYLNDLDEVHQKPKNSRLQAYANIQHYLDSNISEHFKIELLIEIVDSIIPTKNEGLLGAYVDCLEEKLEHFHIEIWDKQLASKVLMKLIDAKKSVEQPHGDYYQRLCKVDMHAAIDSHK